MTTALHVITLVAVCLIALALMWLASIFMTLCYWIMRVLRSIDR